MQLYRPTSGVRASGAPPISDCFEHGRLNGSPLSAGMLNQNMHAAAGLSGQEARLVRFAAVYDT